MLESRGLQRVRHGWLNDRTTARAFLPKQPKDVWRLDAPGCADCVVTKEQKSLPSWSFHLEGRKREQIKWSEICYEEKESNQREQFMSEKHCFGQQRHKLLSPFNKSEKGSQRNNILFPHFVSCGTRKAIWVFWLKIPCPHATFGVIVNLVMGLRGGPVQGARVQSLVRKL